MKKSIRIVLLLSIYIAKTALLFSQENNGQINLSGLFNENDNNPTTVSNRYTQLPEDSFSHTQIMNIPTSSQANLLHKVLIIVDSTLYSELDFEINRYAYDIHYVYGCNVIMEQVDSESCLDIKSLIVSYQNNLDGCVLIGDIAPAFYKTADVIHNNEIAIWPCDLYYMDLTGVWSDQNNDIFFDHYSGDMKPEVFIGRISTANMGNLIGEIEGMRLYLNKNHKYWIGHRKVNKKYALAYTDKSWQNNSYFSDHISHLYGGYKESFSPDGNPSFYGKPDYLERLSNYRYEFVQLAAHSYFYSHVPINEYTHDTLWGSELYSHNIKTLGFNLFCCSACCWTIDTMPSHAFLAGDYIYSPNSEGLSVVGSTKVGGMYPFAEFYSSLHNGETMGQSLVDWWRYKNTNVNNVDSLLCWNYGMTIIGDPLVNFFHCTNGTCQDVITLTSYDNTNSPLSYYLASEKILIPSSASFVIPVKDHCILNAPTVEIQGEFFCPRKSTLEILNEGCQDNCDEE